VTIEEVEEPRREDRLLFFGDELLLWEECLYDENGLMELLISLEPKSSAISSFSS
jgi:hypothetical protein